MERQPTTGGEAIINTLGQNGVEYVFGVSGGAALPMFDALRTTDTAIELIQAIHEQGATHMADGYARASGKLGVTLVTSGPGAGNTITGIMTAYMDSVAVAVICGQVPTTVIGEDAFQETNIIAISKPIVKHNHQATNPDELSLELSRAIHIATTGRHRPVLFDVPKDVSQNNISVVRSFETPPSNTGDGSTVPDPNSVIAIADAWRQAKRPVILAGHGVLLAASSSELLQLALQQETPVTTTLLGKGAIPESHALSLGMLGMHGTAYANKAIIEADFLLDVGSRFDDRIVGDAESFCKDAFIAHVDIDQREIGKIITPNVGIQADARVFLKAMLGEMALGKTVDRSDWQKQLTEYKKDFPLSYETGNGLTMQRVIDETYKLTRGQAIVTADVGQHQMWAAQFYKTERPNTWITSAGAGTMGFGLPAAIGAQLAKPNEQVIAFVGDGGFQMTMCELATACNQKLPIKIIILDNSYLGMVRQWQELHHDNREIGVGMPGNPDFVKLAECYGAAGILIDSEDSLEAGLAQAFEITDRPVVVHAKVRKTDNVYPMIPPGASYDKMLLGPPKNLSID
ncbi:MAG TPA: biosynthetic-type acetolactate synthase large subunit [Candidatus Dormibacteraeota bacterium]|nr:biosynthetic-type acetolactate synthase large subunit [Candidatus Dormibacteraeota bacterium]